MKKLSLLVALGLFTLGTATMVKAQEPEITLPADEPAVENESSETVEPNYDDPEIMDRADLNGDGELSDEEKAAFEAGFEAENNELEEVK